MAGNAKVGDLGSGICGCHKSPISYITQFVTGSVTVNVNGSPACIIGSIGISSCGHPSLAISGATTVFMTSQAAHVIGSSGNNCGGPYQVITGSSNVDTE